MNASLWWWALPVLLLPILWHRKKREQTQTLPLATARFLPRSEPLQLRVWRWSDPLLLLLRCMLLATLIALLADLVLPWRGDTVLVVPGSAAAAVDKEAQAAGFADAARLALPDRNASAWIHAHEREFEPEARLLVVGDAAMPAVLPRFRHPVTLRTAPAISTPLQRHVAIFSDHADAWRRLFAALDGPLHVIVDARPDAHTELIVWDRPEAPPANLRAPLWLIANAAAFPELAQAPQVGGLHYADSPRGRLWSSAAWPPRDADAARTLVADWQRLHAGVQPYAMPAQALAPDAAAPAGAATGALRDRLALLLIVLFALERILTHVRRR
nr:hypothetical protein [uncultured Massilia sp.]